MALLDGNSFEITCTAVGDENVTIEWYTSDGSNITGDAVLGSYNSTEYTINR